MFTVKVFNDNGIRQTYLCDSYTIDSNKNVIGMHDHKQGGTTNLKVGKLYCQIYVENPAGKTIDAFKYVDKGKDSYYQGFESFTYKPKS